MDKSVQITLIIVAAIAIMFLIGVSMFSDLLPTNIVTGNGQATVKAMPDLVGLYFSIETTSSDATTAKDKNAEIVDSVIISLLKQGFERKEITTESFNVYPDYSWENGKQELKGYKATHSLRLEMPASDSGKIGDALDAGVDAGALVSYINFELTQEKQNEYKAQALKLAAEDARIKAEAVASGLGKKLGKVVSTSDSSFGYYPWALYRNDAMISGAAEAKSATTNIQPGSQDISAGVSVVYKLA